MNYVTKQFTSKNHIHAQKYVTNYSKSKKCYKSLEFIIITQYLNKLRKFGRLNGFSKWYNFATSQNVETVHNLSMKIYKITFEQKIWIFHVSSCQNENKIAKIAELSVDT